MTEYRCFHRLWHLIPLCKIAHEICYLHVFGIAHRDLKPSNVVINKVSNIPHLVDTYCEVDRFWYVKDQSGSFQVKHNYIRVPNTGTTRYNAPEVFRNAHLAEGDRGRVFGAKMMCIALASFVHRFFLWRKCFMEFSKLVCTIN